MWSFCCGLGAGSRCRGSGLRGRFQRRALLDRESRNLAWLSLIEDLEVFLLQVADRMALHIAHHYRNEKRVNVNLKSDAGVRWLLRSILCVKS